MLWRERANLRSIFESGNYRFLTFAPPGHFYSPIPDISTLHDPSQAVGGSSTDIPGVDLCADAQVELAREFVAYYGEIPFPDSKQDGYRYHFDNVYFSYGDGVVLYSMMRHFRPQRVIEVGSGHSSAAMLDVSDAFFSGEIDFTFVEPYPDRLFSLLRGQDTKRCRILQRPVQDVPKTLFANLHDNDILFVDSSHVAKTHSDVVYLFSTVLPALNKGVIIHFHDILWPFEYPQSWLRDGRAWNEAYFLRAFLQFNNTFRIMYFNSMMETHSSEFLRSTMPLAMKTPSSIVTPGNSSLWIRKVR